MKITLRNKQFLTLIACLLVINTVLSQQKKLIHFWDFNNTIPLSGVGDVGGNGDSLGTLTHPLPFSYSTQPLLNAKIVYTRPHTRQGAAPQIDSVLDNDIDGGFYYDYSGSNYNYYHINDSSAAATLCGCSGNLCIRTRNPSLNAYLYIHAPTTGYMNINLFFALSATSNKGAQYNIFSYSTDGGITWNPLTMAMDTFTVGGGIRHPDTLLANNSITDTRAWMPVHIDFTSAGAANNNGNFIIRFFSAGSNSTLITGSDRYDNISIMGDSVCPVISNQPVNKTICAGSNTFFETSVAGGLGGNTYQWQVNTGSGFNNIINGGVYSGANTDSLILTNVPVGMNGYKYRCIIHCASCNNDTTTIATLTVNPQPTVTATASANPICVGSSETLSGGGANTYIWTGGVTNGVPFTPASTQTYTVSGTDVNGCTDTASITVTVNPLPVVTANTNHDTVCLGGNVILTGGGATTYVWSGGVTNGVPFTPATTQTYTVTGTDVNGCTNTASVTVTVNPLPTVTAHSTSTSVCLGSGAILTGGGANTYVWTGGVTNGVPYIPAATQTYTVTGTDANGCTNTASVTITVNPLPTVTAHASANPICVGSSETLTGGGATSYVWTGGVTNGVPFTPASTQTYTVTGTDANGCTDTASVIITVNPIPNPHIFGITSLCSGDSSVLSASGGINYQWSTGSTLASIKVTPTVTTTYTLQASNGVCNHDTTVTVNVTPTPVPSVNSIQPICKGNSIKLQASGGTTYHWIPSTGLNNAFIAGPLATPALTTTYTVIEANGICQATDSIVVVVNPLPSEAASPNVNILLTQSTQLNVAPQLNGNSYLWQPTDGLSCTTCPDPVATPTTTTKYYITTTDSLGCTITDTVIVSVKDECGYLFVPNAFSPNGDGHNDVLLVYGVCIEKMDFVVFDRWGNKVFESESQDMGWDGTFKGQKMNPDTYTYYLSVTLIDGSKQEKSGNVALVR